MKWLQRPSSEPLWKEEFSVRTADERYVTRRQLTKFLVLTSFGMFVGNLWILMRSMFSRGTSYPQQTVARLAEIPVGGVRLFTYPTKDDHCILVRMSETEHVSYSQKCTHLSCAVYYSRENNRLECPCHKGFFSIADGSVIQGPPSRALPRIVLESRDGELVAIGIKTS
jgi:nitrite reductase/ring-hydroxylating ferredoxin subunit